MTLKIIRADSPEVRLRYEEALKEVVAQLTEVLGLSGKEQEQELIEKFGNLKNFSFSDGEGEAMLNQIKARLMGMRRQAEWVKPRSTKSVLDLL